MKTSKPKYPIHQCALYKCKSKKKLESLLTIEPGDLRNIQHTIKYHSFDIDKKNSAEKRRITAPERTLKTVQKRILSLLQYIERPSHRNGGGMPLRLKRQREKYAADPNSVSDVKFK